MSLWILQDNFTDAAKPGYDRLMQPLCNNEYLLVYINLNCRIQLPSKQSWKTLLIWGPENIMHFSVLQNNFAPTQALAAYRER